MHRNCETMQPSNFAPTSRRKILRPPTHAFKPSSRRAAGRKPTPQARMVRAAAPVRSIVANVARRFQSAHAAQAGWQQMVKQAQEQSIKGTASVVATSRSVGAADVQPKAEPAREAKPKCAASSASAWQQMVEMANKLGSVDEARVDHPKVTMKVMAETPAKQLRKMLHRGRMPSPIGHLRLPLTSLLLPCRLRSTWPCETCPHLATCAPWTPRFAPPPSDELLCFVASVWG